MITITKAHVGWTAKLRNGELCTIVRVCDLSITYMNSEGSTGCCRRSGHWLFEGDDEHDFDIVELYAPTREAEKEDEVNSPFHYTQGSVECIDAIKAALTPVEFRGYCKGNIIKYVWRERHKQGRVALEKARWYLDKLIEEMPQ